LLKLITTDIDILSCELNLYPYFHFRREALQVQDVSGRLAIPGTLPPHYRLFFRLSKTLPSSVSLRSSFHSYKNSISYLVTAGTSY